MPTPKRKRARASNPHYGRGWQPPRRKSTAVARRENPGAITGILMDGLWVGAGMWAGGLIGGIIAPITGGLLSSLGPIGGLAQGVLTAYIVGWLGSRIGGHGTLMAAGAFAPSAVAAVSGLLGGVGGLFGGGGGGGSIVQTGGNTGGAALPATPNPPNPANPVVMQNQGAPDHAYGGNVLPMPPVARAQV